MQPTSHPARPEASAATTPPASVPARERPHGRPRPLEPIGKAKLRQLREAILNGTYPTDDAVIGGLARMFLGTADDDRSPGRRRR